MPKIGIIAAELLRMRSGGEDNLDKALGVVLRNAKNDSDMADRLSDRLGEMQIRLEAANGDGEKQYAAYLEHIGKVKELLEIESEDDLYEKIRSLKNIRPLTAVALANAGLPHGLLLSFIGDRADELAAMHTANAQLFRENLALQQELEALKELHEAEVDRLGYEIMDANERE